MTTHDLFRCIGALSDEFIEEAAEIKRKNRWLPIAALAACAVLAISIPLTLHGAQKIRRHRLGHQRRHRAPRGGCVPRRK